MTVMMMTTPSQPIPEPNIYDVRCPKCGEENYHFAGHSPVINVVREQDWSGVYYFCTNCSACAQVNAQGELVVRR